MYRRAAAARIRRATFFAVLLAVVPFASADYDAYGTYYSAATGTGATLKAQLKSIMTNGYDVTSYNEAEDYLALTDANPANTQQMLLVYDRVVVTKASKTSVGFVGNYGSREHVWPDSRQDVAAANGDIQMLKPSESSSQSTSSNAQRSNYFYGGATLTGAARVIPANGSNAATFFAGDADKGDVARISFYAATTYGPTLSLINGTTASTTDPATKDQTGDLNTLLHWHYLDAPDTFEMRRNDVIYRGDDSATAGDDYTWAGQGNRNAYIDHPEYVWSVFADQANDTKLSLGTASADGSSVATVNLGRVLKGGTAGTQTLTLNKAGVDGTYYSVTTGGSATSSVTGRYNAFAMDAPGTKAITVGLNASTATAGLKTGTVTVDNLDVTTQGGAGVGANDGNDVANVALSVLDVSNSSFASGADVNALSLNFGTVKQGSTPAAIAFAISNLASALGADLTAGLDLDSITLASGESTKLWTTLGSFKALAAGDAKAFSASFDASALGSYSAVYTLALSDEDLPGTQSTTSLTLTLSGTVIAVPEPTSTLTISLVGATLLRRRRRRAVAA